MLTVCERANMFMVIGGAVSRSLVPQAGDSLGKLATHRAADNQQWG